MKWIAKIRVQQHQCCPTKFYWIGRDIEVEAPSLELAEQRVRELTATQVVEIKHIEEKHDSN